MRFSSALIAIAANSSFAAASALLRRDDTFLSCAQDHFDQAIINALTQVPTAKECLVDKYRTNLEKLTKEVSHMSDVKKRRDALQFGIFQLNTQLMKCLHPDAMNIKIRLELEKAYHRVFDSNSDRGE